MLTYILFAIGFVFLIKGADYLVDGSASIAKKFSISNIVIGLTVVAFGTSAPELIVTILSGMAGQNDLIMGNLMGSNISNILLILGVAAVIYPLKTQHGTVWKEIPFALLGVVLVGVFALDRMIDGAAVSVISRSEGLALLGFFIIFMYYTFGIAKVESANRERVEEFSTIRSSIYILIGLVGLALGGNWIVDGAQVIARQFGIAESVIGLTILAIGTSLPELATAVAAARKKQADIAIGNVVGSNIFNIFFILGIGATISPVHISPDAVQSILMAVLVTIVLFLSMFVGKRHLISRLEGWMFVAGYAVYIASLFISYH